MSANDIYIIREVPGNVGGVYDVHHFDMDAYLDGDTLGRVVARCSGLIEAIAKAEEAPAEYNYRIEFIGHCQGK